MSTNTWHKDYPLLTDITMNLVENNSMSKMLNLVTDNTKVLEFGCATGYFSKLLVQKGCQVTGVEINEKAAKIAEQYCEKVIVADLDVVKLNEILPEQAFDVVIFGDVLEHLREPWQVLGNVINLLKSGGFVVASVPNIAHGAVRLALLEGEFNYQKLGILDDSHLRFFTRKTLEELFDRSGYFLDVIDRTRVPVFSGSELLPKIDRNNIAADVIKKIEADEESETLQFIVRAYPLSPENKYAAAITKNAELTQKNIEVSKALDAALLELDLANKKNADRSILEKIQSKLISIKRLLCSP
jgi:O-antigen biosynthesis protein